MPVDIVGNEIKVGDQVVFGHGQTMRQGIGKVTKICEKTVKIEWKNTKQRLDFTTRKYVTYIRNNTTYREFDNVVVVIIDPTSFVASKLVEYAS